MFMLRKNCRITRTIGIAVLAFGAGVLLSGFLPVVLMVWIEAALLVAAGLLYFTQ